MLSEKMKEKMRKQKTVGHDAGSVISHKLMEHWIKEVEELEAKAGQHETIVILQNKIKALYDAQKELERVKKLPLSKETKRWRQIIDDLSDAENDLFKEVK